MALSQAVLLGSDHGCPLRIYFIADTSLIHQITRDIIPYESLFCSPVPRAFVDKCFRLYGPWTNGIFFYTRKEIVRHESGEDSGVFCLYGCDVCYHGSFDYIHFCNPEIMIDADVLL